MGLEVGDTAIQRFDTCISKSAPSLFFNIRQNQRKLAIWHIFAPYLLNIRGLSPGEAQGIISDWLEECGKLRKLDFTPSYKIKGALDGSRDFLPVSCDKLKVENEGFYNLLQDNGVITYSMKKKYGSTGKTSETGTTGMRIRTAS